MQKQPLLLGLFPLTAILPIQSYAQQNAHESKPNIVVFIADDAGMDYGCYGNPYIKTPNIDALGRGGICFDNAFLTASQSSPSRTSMLSGRFAHTIGTEDLHTGLPDSVKILPAYLHEAGYYTGIMLKSHLGKNGDRQFDWNDNGFYPDWVQGKWNAKALDNFNQFLDSAGTQPFFLWVGFVDPHRAYRDEDSVNAAPRVNDPGRTIVPPFLADDAQTRDDLSAYYDEISRMDAHIGNMTAALEKRGLRENTIIIYLSDNGMPFPGAKATAYDAGIRTPLIFNWPGHISPSTRYTGLTSTIDLAPTLLDLAGVEKPQHMFGQTFKAALFDQTTPGREHIFAERNWHGTDEHIRCIRTTQYKLILNSYIELPLGTPSDLSTSPSWYALKERQRKGKLTPGQQRIFNCPRPSIELYDIVNDPNEFVNLAFRPEHKKTVGNLSKQLDTWRKSTGDHPSHMRRKPDEVDRITGVPFKNTFNEMYND